MALTGQDTHRDDALVHIATGRHRDPFAVLGPHRTAGGIVIRTVQPAATGVEVCLVPGGELRPMQRRLPEGLYELVLPGGSGADIPDYRLRITFGGGHQIEVDDPYRYGRVLTDFDLHLLGEGTHHRAFEKLGAHRVHLGRVAGVHFAVWAPNADRVSIVGDLNGWDGRVHPMRHLGPSGIWEIFIPGLADGEKYKYEIRTKAGHLLKKSDPFAFAFEMPPNTASVVRDISRYRWNDSAWLEARRGRFRLVGARARGRQPLPDLS
jgi:1,4-alpha-glucan branching enzyme